MPNMRARSSLASQAQQRYRARAARALAASPRTLQPAAACLSLELSFAPNEKPAATLQGVDGVMPDLLSALARALAQCTRAMHKHRCGAQARGASLRARLAGIFGKAKLSASCG